MKKVLFPFALLLGLTGSTWAYDFSAVSPSGHTLYYNVYTYNTVYLTYPNDTASSWSNTWVGYSKPVGNVVIPDSVQAGGQWYRVLRIGYGAFAYCTAVSSVTLPVNLQYIGKCAFQACSNLSTINLDNTNVTTIRRNAFQDCSGLSTVEFPVTLTEIDTSLFYGCTGLQVITIPENIGRISMYAFKNCLLDTVYFNSDSCDVESGWVLYADGGYVGGSALVNFSSLRANNIIFGDNVTNIDGVLTPVPFNQVGSYSGFPVYEISFWSNYQTITFGRNVQQINGMCLNGINGITFKGNTPPRIFYRYPEDGQFSFPCTVPCGTATQYRASLPYLTNFEEDEGPSFTAFSDNDNMGVVQILNVPTCANPNAVLNAVPTSGYRFDHWSTGSTQNPYSFMVTSDTTVIAYFAATGGTESINDVDGDNVRIYAIDGNIVVEEAENEKVIVLDMLGCHVGTHSLPTGVYMVKIGNHPVRKVVVTR